MTEQFEPPSEGFLSELHEVAAAAGGLQAFFERKRPNLPTGFNKAPLNRICRALLILPDGSADIAIKNLIAADERLPVFRPRLPQKGDNDEDGPAFDRGGELDQQISKVILAVTSAIYFYANEHPDWERPPLDRNDQPVSPDDDTRQDLKDLAEETGEAQREIGKARKKLPADEDAGRAARAVSRGAADAESTAHLTKAELSQSEPKPNRLIKLGDQLLSGVEAVSGFIAEHSEELTEPWIKEFSDAWNDSYRGIVKRVKGIANAVRENAQTIKRIRKRSRPPVADDGFDIVEVHEMIIRGEEPPEVWRPMITSLGFADESRLTSLSAVKNLSALETLAIDDTPVSDITPLQNLAKLRVLYLNNTQVTDLSPLKDLTNLERLHLSNTRVTDLSPLRDLTSLQFLVLSGTQVTDLSPLRDLANLESLNFYNTQVTDLSPLRDLTSLQFLVLNATQVTDLSPIRDLTSLQFLVLNATQVTDLSPLKDLASLRNLLIDNTQVTDLSPLRNLNNLERLALNDTQVADLSPLRSLRNLKKIRLHKSSNADRSVLDHLEGLRITESAMDFFE